MWGFPLAHIGLVSFLNHIILIPPHHSNSPQNHHPRLPHQKHSSQKHLQMGSQYMTVCVSVERYITLAHPYW